MNQCSTCGALYDGEYCPYCGELSEPDKTAAAYQTPPPPQQQTTTVYNDPYQQQGANPFIQTGNIPYSQPTPPPNNLYPNNFGNPNNMNGMPFQQQSYQTPPNNFYQNQPNMNVNNYNIFNQTNMNGNYGVTSKPKSKILAAVLATLGFCGCAGLHRFYSGKIGTGILYFCTGGLFGIGTIVDLVRIIKGNFTDSNGRPLV